MPELVSRIASRCLHRYQGEGSIKVLENGKSLIRNEILRLRSSLGQEAVEQKSLKIAEKLFGLDQFKKSGLVMCYMDFNNEVRTDILIKKCFEEGKRVALPRVVKNSGIRKEIAAYEIKDTVTNLEKGTYGIMEPKMEITREVNPPDIDLVIVPGVAFDTRKNRIGYGAGYYDRFLKKVRSGCFKIALAFELQVVDDIPAGGDDVPVDMIITEERIIY